MNDVPVISMDTAALVTDTSKRTLWRRLSAGKLQRHSMDEQGRVMLAFKDIEAQLCIVLSAPASLSLLLDADRGVCTAQNDLALLFLEQERPDLAFHWFMLAAQQQHPDAMHYLSHLYSRGLGIKPNETEAMLWLAKAARAGHAIAQAQMTAITGTDE